MHVELENYLKEVVRMSNDIVLAKIENGTLKIEPGEDLRPYITKMMEAFKDESKKFVNDYLQDVIEDMNACSTPKEFWDKFDLSDRFDINPN